MLTDLVAEDGFDVIAVGCLAHGPVRLKPFFSKSVNHTYLFSGLKYVNSAYFEGLCKQALIWCLEHAKNACFGA